MDIFFKLMNALSHTLIISLWLGMVLAAFTGLTIICTVKWRPAYRYRLLIAMLLLFVLWVVFTFIGEFWGERQTTGTGFYHVLFDFVEVHSIAIVITWSLLVGLRTVQLLLNLHSIYTIRRGQVTDSSTYWKNRVAELAAQLGIRRLVRIAESGIARVPMVIGHLKPLILIPAGLMTALSPAAIEAILMHELAHIRRRDYLMNILLSVLEILFCFNPAILWIASLIRQERENCCDDVAVSHTGNQINYINVLVACQEFHLTAPAYAMPFNNNKNQLTHRVKRLLTEYHPGLNLLEKSVVVLCMAGSVLLPAVFTHFKGNYRIADDLSLTVAAVQPGTPERLMDVGLPFYHAELSVDSAVLSSNSTNLPAGSQMINSAATEPGRLSKDPVSADSLLARTDSIHVSLTGATGPV